MTIGANYGESRTTLEKLLHQEFIEADGFLARLAKSTPWEDFREALDVLDELKIRANGGRPGYDKLTLFKCLILQEAYGLSDKALESAIKDRLSFRFFIGVGLNPVAPDRVTIVRFRKRLIENELYKTLIERFKSSLASRGLQLYRSFAPEDSLVAPLRLRKRSVRRIV